MEPLKDLKDGTARKSVNAQNMVRTDFKEQKLEKFFFENAACKEEDKPKALNASITEEEFERYHQLFLDGVERLEDKIMNKTANNIMEVDDGGYLFRYFIMLFKTYCRYNWPYSRLFRTRNDEEKS